MSDRPTFTVLYHTFFSPIIWKGKKGSSHKQPQEVSIEEIKKEIEAFNPTGIKIFHYGGQKKNTRRKSPKLTKTRRKNS
jgi:hypothetical protein